MNLSKISQGTVQWRPAREAVPVTKETKTEGNVTTNIISGGQEAEPSCFEVTFFIGFSHGSVGPDHHDHLHLTVQVPAQDSDQPYSVIEEQAARQLPDVIQALADAVAQDIDRIDRERAARQ